MTQRQLGPTELKRLHRSWKRRPRPRLALLLDNVAGPFNVGAITRTAAAHAVDWMLLVGDTPELSGAKVQKTALGTDRYLHDDRYETAQAGIDAARRDGYAVIALELAEDAIPISELELSRDTCFLIGHEDRGVSTTVLSACDGAAFIPQLGKVGSLNVASATAIACFEARRQGWAANDASGP